MRKAFNFFRSYYEIASELSDKDRLAFYDALMLEQFTGQKTELKGLAKFAYLLIRIVQVTMDIYLNVENK